MKLSLTLKSLFLFELLLEGGFRIIKSFISINLKRP
jgi:hypothetical protein